MVVLIQINNTDICKKGHPIIHRFFGSEVKEINILYTAILCNDFAGKTIPRCK